MTESAAYQAEIISSYDTERDFLSAPIPGERDGNFRLEDVVDDGRYYDRSRNILR